MHGQYNGKDVLELVKKWYDGTATLKEGEVLCYDLDDTAAPVTGADPSQAARGVAVTDPLTANLNAVAGVVADTSSGKTGPCWVDLIIPRKGSVVNIYSNANATKGTTVLAPANGTRTAASFADATLNLPLLAVALQTVDRSSTSGLILSKFV